ncbi:MAG: homocysteine S-methyltransferase family protein [Pseudomonadales bacterium]|nr:homocysteine S-methyltransferase [Gammaproteobacteria bacterium]MCH1597679.1 homocysteine S-methyltransferase family protein [Pseudomonadales bacterium]RPG31490.1 MAG: homocysteine S-methyltransferase family protein [Gammaproteobacteria bacterium TMED243]
MNHELQILDGSMGAELIKRGLTPRTGLWSARALLDEPEGVVQVHAEYIEAGASVITTNSYSTIPSYLAKAGMAESYQELTVVAAKLARRAADAATIPVRVAGCLPPLDESYRHDLVPEDEPSQAVYRELVTVLTPYADLYLCETMSCVREAVNASSAARAVDPHKPLWVAWTLHETPGEGLRSGESLADALAAVQPFEPDAYLFNCTSPAAISAAVETLAKLTNKPIGAYPNSYHVPEGWTLDNEKSVEARDMTTEDFVAFSRDWRNKGASILGGCCGIGPSHIDAMAKDLGA